MNVSQEHKSKFSGSGLFPWALSLVPALLIVLFYLFRSHTSLMESVFRGFTVPAGNRLAQWTSPLPFSAGEALGLLLILWATFRTLRGLWLSVVKRKGLRPLIRGILPVLLLSLWLWAALCWLWNIGYCMPGLAETLHLDRGGVSGEELEQTARYFAGTLNACAGDIRRDDSGLFSHEAQDFFPEAPAVYDLLEQAFPELTLRDAMPKKLLLPRVQSHMGFSGFYSPFTGEANINTDIPLSSQPFTIAHEMAHQRHVASEDEADFLGVAACLSSGRPIYIYSGALAGLKMLAGPLAAQDPAAWQAIAATLPPEVAADWNRSIDYWAQFKTPLEEWSRDAYDAFLKSQGEELGIRSYGACVDLLVNCYSAGILVNPYSE